jgi:SAM-dependent methyltransferase
MVDNPIWKESELNGNVEFSKDVETISKLNTWDALFKDPNWILLEPAEEIISFYNKYIMTPSRQLEERLRPAYQKVHDLGCGGGRHVYYFAEKGHYVIGTDLSTNGIDFTRSELEKRGLNAILKICPMTELPFADSEFDVTISRATINHATLQDMKKSVYEMARTTRKGGLLFLTLISDRSSEWKKGDTVIENLSYIPTEGPEKGLIHTFLDAANSVALVEPFFRVEELYLSEHPPMIKQGINIKQDNTYFGSEYVLIGVRR